MNNNKKFFYFIIISALILLFISSLNTCEGIQTTQEKKELMADTTLLQSKIVKLEQLISSQKEKINNIPLLQKENQELLEKLKKAKSLLQNIENNYPNMSKKDINEELSNLKAELHDIEVNHKNAENRLISNLYASSLEKIKNYKTQVKRLIIERDFYKDKSDKYERLFNGEKITNASLQKDLSNKNDLLAKTQAALRSINEEINQIENDWSLTKKEKEEALNQLKNQKESTKADAKLIADLQKEIEGLEVLKKQVDQTKGILGTVYNNKGNKIDLFSAKPAQRALYKNIEISYFPSLLVLEKVKNGKPIYIILTGGKKSIQIRKGPMGYDESQAFFNCKFQEKLSKGTYFISISLEDDVVDNKKFVVGN